LKPVVRMFATLFEVISTLSSCASIPVAAE